MKKELVAAFASNEITGTAPDWIMFAPAGTHEIDAKLDGKPSRVKVTVDKAGAVALQRDLEARRAEGGPQPFFDLHHDARDATAYPQEFAWRTFIVNGEEREGIGARVIWTPRGLEATKSDPSNGILPSVRYFSPRCAVVRGRIAGLLDSSSGNAAGGLVSDPAFERIAPLVAAKQTTPTNMDDIYKKRLMKALGKSEEEEMDEDAMVMEIEAAYQAKKKLAEMEAANMPKPEEVKEMAAAKAVVESENANLKAELEAARTEIAKGREERADSFVRELVASGKIPAKASGTQKVWRSSYLADAEAALEASKELSAALAPDGKRITDDVVTTPQDSGAVRQAKAQELLASKKATTFAQAWELAGQITA